MAPTMWMHPIISCSSCVASLSNGFERPPRQKRRSWRGRRFPHEEDAKRLEIVAPDCLPLSCVPTSAPPNRLCIVASRTAFARAAERLPVISASRAWDAETKHVAKVRSCSACCVLKFVATSQQLSMTAVSNTLHVAGVRSFGKADEDCSSLAVAGLAECASCDAANAERPSSSSTTGAYLARDVESPVSAPAFRTRSA